MKRHKKLSKSEMSGFIFLLLVILIISLLKTYHKQWWDSPVAPTPLTQTEINEIKAFAEQVRKDSLKYSAKRNTWKTGKKELTPFTFDPNTADSQTLIRIGLEEWQVNNVLKYRQHGGRWRNPKDFSKLYGLAREDFAQLLPYIKIKKSAKEKEKETQAHRRDSLIRQYPKKYETGTILSLNDVDTTALKGIPGIGSYYASKICRYRERLGGFVDLSQLKEIEGLPEGIEKWFAISPQVETRKTRINHTDFKGLVRHPYLNYEQVKTISNYLRKYGNISSIEELSNLENFTEKDIDRLKNYLSFD